MTEKEKEFLKALEEVLKKYKLEDKRWNDKYCPCCGRPYVDYWPWWNPCPSQPYITWTTDDTSAAYKKYY